MVGFPGSHPLGTGSSASKSGSQGTADCPGLGVSCRGRSYLRVHGALVGTKRGSVLPAGWGRGLASRRAVSAVYSISAWVGFVLHDRASASSRVVGRTPD